MLIRFLKNCKIFAAPDDGTTGAGSTGTNQAGDQTGTEGDQTGKDQSQASDGKNNNQQTDSQSFEQLKKDFGHLLKTHTEMKSKWDKKEEDEIKLREEALKKKGEYEKLYETSKKELEELKPRTEKLEEIISAYLKNELKSLPDAAKVLIDTNKPIESQLEMIVKLKESGLLEQTKKKQGDGTPPGGGGNIAKFTDIYTK